MGAEYRRGSMSAWLLKKKSGSAMVRMRQYNKRYFTIDFDSHVFFYSHAEGSKKVSSVIRFSDIADVRLPDPHGGAAGTESTSTTNEKRGSKLLRSFSGLGRSSGSSSHSLKDGMDQAHHFVVVAVKPSMKTMELLCSSSLEAEQWHQALKEAMLYSADLVDDRVGACVATTDPMSGDDEGEAFRTVALSSPTHETGASPSVARTADRKPPGPVGAAAVATAKAALATPKPALSAPQRAQEKSAESANTPLLSGGYPANASDTSAPPTAQKHPPTVQSSLAPEVVPTKETASAPRIQQSTAPLASAVPPPAPAPTSSAVEATARSPTPVKVDGTDGETAPPPQKGTFLDLSTEPVSTEAVTAPSHGGYSGGKRVEAVQEVVVETGGLLQQSDFGFEAGEDTDSSGSAVSTPREGATKTVDGLASQPAKPDIVTSSSPQADAPPSRFGDRDRGLSMQERLQNLEFSDDEEYDDDDPLGLKSKPK